MIIHIHYLLIVLQGEAFGLFNKMSTELPLIYVTIRYSLHWLCAFDSLVIKKYVIKRMFKAMITAYFKILFKNCPGRTKENHWSPQAS
jgi:hypothetical protein